MQSLMSSIFLLSLWTLPSLAATESVLQNCYLPSQVEFFTHQLGEVARQGEVPLLLLDNQNQVVGLIKVENQQKNTKTKRVLGLSLCSSLQVDSFYYTKDVSSDLLTWTSEPEIEMTQDEGMIVMSANLMDEYSFAKKYSVSFKAYDIFKESEEVESEKGLPGFLDDWGTPRATGTFYFYTPEDWK